MDISEILTGVEDTVLRQFKQLLRENEHHGDRGENAEELVMQFLRPRLPGAYGLVKGEVIFPNGSRSHSCDIIIYDQIYGSLLSIGRTSLVPSDSVYGIVEVTSTLSKRKLHSTLDKIIEFTKKFPQRQVRENLTPAISSGFVASRPFASIFAFQLANNSLDSLSKNISEYEDDQVLESLNMVAVLGEGLIGRYVEDTLTADMLRILTTEDLANALRQKASEKWAVTIAAQDFREKTLGQFYVQLLLTLDRMHLGRPDLRSFFPSFEDRIPLAEIEIM